MTEDRITATPSLPAAKPVPRTQEPTAEPRGIFSTLRHVLFAPQAKPTSNSNVREIIETIVFVVVLVLLLKSFIAEAFVIPTGSMAETLYGLQKEVTCPQCSQKFPVNCSSEVEPDREGKRRPVLSCICPNCRYHIVFGPELPSPSCDSGDRVLVGKFVYDTGLFPIEPLDVVVFKFPEEPQRDFVPMNYIKRLIGRPGQTIGIYYGNLYVAEGLTYDPDLDRQYDLQRRTYKNAKKDLLENWDLSQGPSPFKILRKPASKALAMRRLVFDNDHLAKDLQDQHYPARWAPEQDGKNLEATAYERKRQLADGVSGWTTAGTTFSHPAKADNDYDWLRYRHLLVPRGANVERAHADAVRPELVIDYMGYSTGNGGGGGIGSPAWVGDLMIESSVQIEQADGELVLELSKGVDRFQAVWQLSTGVCKLVRLPTGAAPITLDEKPTNLKKPGSYRIRFANFDERLTVWVDSTLPFGEGVTYEPPTERRGPALVVAHGPSEKNDLEPASIGVRGGGLKVSELKLWRDTYYTVQENVAINSGDWSNPAEWNPLRNQHAMSMYVQPGHYLCLGDNSPHSSDSRIWTKQSVNDDHGGLVPERLMLGRALMVYYPFSRFGPIK